jgi:hypothetical protein
MTAEDILPLWLRKELLSLYPVTGPDGPRRLKLRICSDCNGRLSARFETPVSKMLKPVVRGQPRAFTFDERRLLAAWLLKTTLLWGFAQQDRYSVLRDATRSTINAVLRTGQPTDGTYIRICRVGMGDVPITSSAVDELRRPRVGRYSVSWHGPLGFELLVGDPLSLRPHMAALDAADTPFARLWPVTAAKRPEALLWPPDGAVSEQSLLELRHAWASGTSAGEPRPIEHSWPEGKNETGPAPLGVRISLRERMRRDLDELVDPPS